MALSAEQLAIIANDRFPLSELSAHQVRQIFLKRTRYLDDIELFAINLPKRDPLRDSFEHDLLKMSPSRLKQHWTKAHYRGVRPPIVQHSIKSVLAFIRQIDGAIGYVPISNVPKGTTILHKVER